MSMAGCMEQHWLVKKAGRQVDQSIGTWPRWNYHLISDNLFCRLVSKTVLQTSLQWGILAKWDLKLLIDLVHCTFLCPIWASGKRHTMSGLLFKSVQLWSLHHRQLCHVHSAKCRRVHGSSKAELLHEVCVVVAAEISHLGMERSVSVQCSPSLTFCCSGCPFFTCLTMPARQLLVRAGLLALGASFQLRLSQKWAGGCSHPVILHSWNPW